MCQEPANRQPVNKCDLKRPLIMLTLGIAIGGFIMLYILIVHLCLQLNILIMKGLKKQKNAMQMIRLLRKK